MNRLGFPLILFALTLVAVSAAADDELTPLEQLGKELFFDEMLSSPPGQSCATCHGEEVGFSGPDSEINAGQVAYPGAIPERASQRKPPSAAYSGDTPVMHYDKEEGLIVGGMFFDGRAHGWILGDPLAEQAQAPFLNPLEQNFPDAHAVCVAVDEADYHELFEEVWGEDSTDPDGDVRVMYERIARALAAYQRSREVNPFTSKYDYYLKGEAQLTEQEARGLDLFDNKAKCAECHPSKPDEHGNPPLFTDFTYDNLGFPANPDIPFYKQAAEFNPDGEAYVDPGLGGFLATVPEYAHLAEANWGKHKVPTLRNVDKRPSPDFVKNFGHNGYFKTLEEITDFYNSRDVKEWPAPEVAANVNKEELGDLKLTDDEIADVVAFMKTLSDGWVPDEGPAAPGGLRMEQ